MATPSSDLDPSTNPHSQTTSNNSDRNSSTSFSIRLPAFNLLQSPLSALLEYSGILPPSLTEDDSRDDTQLPNNSSADPSSVPSGEVSIQIITAREQEHDQEFDPLQDTGLEGAVSQERDQGSTNSSSTRSGGQSFDIQQLARCIEQILPFSLLLLVIFVRQHLQGFLVIIWIIAILFKSNDIIRKQTALKGERRTSVLVITSTVYILHVVSVYWWCQNDDLFYPLMMLPPKSIPPFWHAIFIIVVNDIMARQVVMAVKCLLLIYYKNGKGHNFRRQGQILTSVEYALLLYRAVLPTPVWYRFFLNKEYGSLFSSLTTGLYLTFKLTTFIEKVQSFIASVKALSCKEVHYGSYASLEQVNAAGDICAICQEKMQTPILLRCKHIFCEDCVSEWFERERTCPLCRALVKPADQQSYGDGSTSMFFQFF